MIFNPSNEDEIREVILPFSFPFYGHPVKTVFVMINGTLSVPSNGHSLHVDSQYIAALLAPLKKR